MSRRNRAKSVGAVVETIERRVLLAFGLTTTSSTYTIDTGAGVVFSILRQGTSSTIHSGDLTSFKYNGVEYAAPFASPGPQRYSHFESGLSNPNLSATPPFIGTQVSATVDPSGNWIKIAADDTTATVGAGATGVIQYYIARKNDPVIYMATYAPEMLVSSTRFITYLDWGKFPNHPNESDTSAIHGTAQSAIESSDVYQDPVDGRTHSKYYAENRLIGHVYHGATGPSAGAFMFIGSRESGSGGPFWKDIDFQSTGAAVELYNIPYSDHSQTESFRPGLHGPYALVLTGGSLPVVTPDYAFLDGVGLTGWVSPSARGTLAGVASGIAAGHVPTVALSNSAAQYWYTPDASGNYTIAGIKPGTYTETLYDEELAVGTRSVTITAGTTTAANITDTFYLPPAIWRIGTWDGTPREFLNGDKITLMHPSDPRMSAWAADSTGVTNFIVGTTPDSAFPMAEWKFQNTNGSGPFMDTLNRITFNLTAQQAATAMTLRIGITRLDHGRPTISVNGAAQSIPGLSAQPNTRGLTLGSWRGNNTTYTWNLGTSLLHAGTNTIDITCASGSGTGGVWLSPWHIYDALDLVTTSSLTNAPVVSSITVSPNNATVQVNATQTFTATARDQFNTITPANFSWSATRGTVNGAGNYIAPATTGADTVTATSGSINGSASVNVIAGGSISGTLFNDSNANGLFDGGETTLGGATIFIDTDSDGKLDGGETTVMSGGAGDYLFNGLPAGSYSIGQVAPAGFVATSEPVATIPPALGNVTANLPDAQIVYTGSGGSDLYTLRRNAGGKFEILLGGNLISTVFAAAPSLTFNLGGGDDVLTLDLVNGEPSPLGGVNFDGGADNDTLAVIGTASAQWPVFDTNALYLNGMTVNTANLEHRTFLGNGGQDQLTVTGGSVALAAPAVLNSLTITAGQFDQVDHNVAVDYPDQSPSPIGSWNGSAYDGLTGLIASGRNGGSGIVSSSATGGLALGIAEATQVLGPSGGAFAGATVDASAVLVKFTYAGDANLDGKINIDDYTAIDSGIAAQVTGWSNGDFNYDGKVNIDDYVIIDSGIANQGPPMANAAAAAMVPPLDWGLFSSESPAIVKLLADAESMI